VGAQRDEVAVRRIWGEVDGRSQGAASLQTPRNLYPPHPRRTESAAAAASQDPHELRTNVTKTIRALMYSGAGARRAQRHVRMRGQASLLRTTARGSSVCHLHAKCLPPLCTAGVGRKRKARSRRKVQGRPKAERIRKNW
ncbi:hypothetical protein K438DRAFT_1876410, partial [Mycena galopus ATCC 62051]